MKNLLLATFATLSLSVGAAYAQGVPAGFHGPTYGSQAFHNATSHQAGGGAASAKGG